jgi:hypothetical protein
VTVYRLFVAMSYKHSMNPIINPNLKYSHYHVIICKSYVYLSNIPAIATENLLELLFSLCSQHVSAPTSLTYLDKALDITTDPL